ncbi:MAG: hypothetical protein ABL903_20605 [Methylococcales bacterium]
MLIWQKNLQKLNATVYFAAQAPIRPASARSDPARGSSHSSHNDLTAIREASVFRLCLRFGSTPGPAPIGD